MKFLKISLKIRMAVLLLSIGSSCFCAMPAPTIHTPLFNQPPFKAVERDLNDFFEREKGIIEGIVDLGRAAGRFPYDNPIAFFFGVGGLSTGVFFNYHRLLSAGSYLKPYAMFFGKQALKFFGEQQKIVPGKPLPKPDFFQALSAQWYVSTGGRFGGTPLPKASPSVLVPSPSYFSSLIQKMDTKWLAGAAGIAVGLGVIWYLIQRKSREFFGLVKRLKNELTAYHDLIGNLNETVDDVKTSKYLGLLDAVCKNVIDTSLRDQEHRLGDIRNQLNNLYDNPIPTAGDTTSLKARCHAAYVLSGRLLGEINAQRRSVSNITITADAGPRVRF